MIFDGCSVCTNKKAGKRGRPVVRRGKWRLGDKGREEWGEKRDMLRKWTRRVFLQE